MFDPSELVAQYGCWAIALGSVLEGETFLLMGGFAAHRGLLDLGAVITVAFVFSFLGDQFYFWMGRHHEWYPDPSPARCRPSNHQRFIRNKIRRHRKNL
ncbi:MAG: hypothetical protein WBD13_08815 [Burkholderiaceae bacterium]